VVGQDTSVWDGTQDFMIDLPALRKMELRNLSVMRNIRWRGKVSTIEGIGPNQELISQIGGAPRE